MCKLLFPSWPHARGYHDSWGVCLEGIGILGHGDGIFPDVVGRQPDGVLRAFFGSGLFIHCRIAAHEKDSCWNGTQRGKQIGSLLGGMILKFEAELL